MLGQIFNIQDDGALVPMEEQPFANEDLFQDLLARYPNLLAGDQVVVFQGLQRHSDNEYFDA